MKMETFLNNHGNTFTEEELEKISDEVTSGNLENFTPVGQVHYGSLRGSRKSNEPITVLYPVGTKKSLEAAAKKRHCTRSDLMRAFVAEGLARMA